MEQILFMTASYIAGIATGAGGFLWYQKRKAKQMKKDLGLEGGLDQMMQNMQENGGDNK